jgi:hypothetical protein
LQGEKEVTMWLSILALTCLEPQNLDAETLLERLSECPKISEMVKGEVTETQRKTSERVLLKLAPRVSQRVLMDAADLLTTRDTSGGPATFVGRDLMSYSKHQKNLLAKRRKKLTEAQREVGDRLYAIYELLYEEKSLVWKWEGGQPRLQIYDERRLGTGRYPDVMYIPLEKDLPKRRTPNAKWVGG